MKMIKSLGSSLFAIGFYFMFLFSAYCHMVYGADTTQTTIPALIGLSPTVVAWWFYLVYGAYFIFISAYALGTHRTTDSLLLIRMATEKKQESKLINNAVSIWFLGMAISFYAVTADVIPTVLLSAIYICRVGQELLLSYRTRHIEDQYRNFVTEARARHD